MDDVGGIFGFCEMLEILYGRNSFDSEALQGREDMLSWATMMGWTGRWISPEKHCNGKIKAFFKLK